MAKFELAYDLMMGHEGGYANNPADTGGMTYKGIARNFNPGWGGWAAVDAARKQSGVASILDKILGSNAELQADVLKFYKLNYWDVNRLDAVFDQELANKLFDIGVNMGVKKAALMWQEALNLTNQNGRAYADTAIDGIVGSQTITLTNAHFRPKLLLLLLKGLQSERYINIMRNNPTQEVFAQSWFSRV
jgi:lysozyme family protein